MNQNAAAAMNSETSQLVEIDGEMLAALLTSRVCHDLAGPINAVNNGVEFMADGDKAAHEQALKVISDSAVLASARLQFFRTAFGASGGRGDAAQTSELRELLSAYLAGGRVTLDWQVEAETIDRAYVQLFLNIALVAAETLPRVGVLRLAVAGGARTKLMAMSEGPRIAFNDRVKLLLAEGKADLSEGPLLSKEAPALFAHRLAKGLRAELSFGQEAGRVLVAATI